MDIRENDTTKGPYLFDTTPEKWITREGMEWGQEEDIRMRYLC